MLIRRSPRPWLPAVLWLSALTLPAQQPRTAPPADQDRVEQDPGATAELVVETSYDRDRSWALFASCDSDSDDRLSLFEARYSLVDLDLAKRPENFRRYDLDHDGFLQWPEFDAYYRWAIERLGKFQVRPVRRVGKSVDPAAAAAKATPSQQLIRMLDSNGDDRLNPEEFEEFLKLSDVDPTLARGFPMVDTNQDGLIDHRELNLPLEYLPGAWKMLPEESPERGSLPLEFRAADRNLDGAIDPKELELSLRRIHPSLSRWTERILKDADRSGDGTLGGPEIQAAQS